MVVLSVYILFFELNVNFNDTIRSELVFTDLKMQDLAVTIDIEIFRVPCEVVDIRFVSRRGRDHTIVRYFSTKQGLVEMKGERSIEEIEESLNKGEGCRLQGKFYKHFVTNNFFIVLGNPQLLAALLMRNGNFQFDLSHRINSLILGDASQSNRDHLEG